MSDQENGNESDREISKDHGKLIEAISKLDKSQRVKNPERNEPSIQVSEFHLVKNRIAEKDDVQLQDLIKTLDSQSHRREITNKLKLGKKKRRVLSKPLEKCQADKFKRDVGYRNAKKEIEKWDPIVTRHRTAPRLVFPLAQPSFIEKFTTDEFVKRFQVQSELEKELAMLESEKQQDDNNKTDDFSLTLEEIIRRRREVSKFRAQQSYREAKAHRQKKIKSKKYHKIQRKEKIKQQLKEFEQLQKTDPEAALEKLEQLEKTRAEERMSLRHKNTGQWAKNKQVRAKYDVESRKILAQQLSISKELTQKIKKHEDSENDDIEDDEGKVVVGREPWIDSTKTEIEIDQFISGYRKYWEEKNKNPQETKEVSDNKDREEKNFKVMDPDIPEISNPVETVIEVDKIGFDKENGRNKKRNKTFHQKGEKISGIIQKSKTKFTSEWFVEAVPTTKLNLLSSAVEVDEIFEQMEEKILQKARKKLKKAKKSLKKSENYLKDEENSENNPPELSFQNKEAKPMCEQALNETLSSTTSIPHVIENQDSVSLKVNTASNKIRTGGAIKRSAEIDPTKFISVKAKYLKTQLPDDLMSGDQVAIDDSDRDEAQHNIISEAFADDDVIDEFRKDKENEIKKSEPEDIDLRLPGWGSWCGKNVKNNLRKKHRFILKFPKEEPRKDVNKGDVIIIEDGNSKVKEHLIAELPYPFTSVADYEASIRAPIGRNFVPENAHKTLTEPPVKTKLGTIIQPMDENVLLKKDLKLRGKLVGNNKVHFKNKKNDKSKK